MIHHTMGVYSDGSRKHNGVDSEHLQVHIDYNKTMRFGRALFVDGKCVYKGYLSQEECDAIEREWAANPRVMTRCTAPYQ